MFISYIRLSIRLAFRNPLFTIINVTGLAIGFAVFFVLLQYSQSELQSDRQWKDSDRIARLALRFAFQDPAKTAWEENVFGTNQTAIPFLMAAEFPEIEDYTRSIHQTIFSRDYVGLDKTIFVAAESPSQGRVVYYEENFISADANFLEFFGIPLVYGSAEDVLRDGKSIVISRTLARKYFGDQSAIGKVVVINDTEDYTVTGVFEDLPYNTHLNFVAVLSNASRVSVWNVLAGPPDAVCYLKKSGVEPWMNFEAKVNSPESLQRYYGPYINTPGRRAEFIVQPLEETAFSELWRRDRFKSKSKFLLNIFRATGVLVLVLATINYINLSAARVSRRMKEIATRKVSGARQFDFFRQFATETLMLFLIALGLAFTLIQLTKMPLQLWLNIPVGNVGGAELGIFSVIVVLALGTTAAYPVWLSWKFNPQALFKSKPAQRRVSPPTYFSSFQYFLAVVMIFCSIQAYRQIMFVLTDNPGYRKEDLVVIDLPRLPTTTDASVNTFINSVKSNPEVQIATRSTRVMSDFGQTISVRTPGASVDVALVTNGGVDENYLAVFEIPLLAGRNFLPDDRKDVILLSSVALTRLGLTTPEEALGQRVEIFSSERPGLEWQSAEVVGVFRSYRHYSFVRIAGEPNFVEPGMCLTYGSGLAAGLVPRRLTLKLNSDAFEAAMGGIAKQYQAIFGLPMNWFFMDEQIARWWYSNDQILGRQVVVFTVLAVFISCLGLLGMLSGKVVEKTKEIGIRKVLGANVLHMVKLLLRQPAGQLLVASLIGLPLAVYVVQSYFEKFTVHVPFIWWHLLIPVVILSAALVVTVFSTVARAVQQNPVEALKHE